MSSSLSYASPLSSKPVSHDLPADYYVLPTRSGYELHLDGYGLVDGEFDCIADAVFAAQDHADALADEQSEADAAAAEEAYEAALDRYHAQASVDAVVSAIDDPVARGKARAARALLAAIDGLATKVAA